MTNPSLRSFTLDLHNTRKLIEQVFPHEPVEFRAATNGYPPHYQITTCMENATYRMMVQIDASEVLTFGCYYHYWLSPSCIMATLHSGKVYTLTEVSWFLSLVKTHQAQI